MKTGMLWFDKSGSLEERIQRAARYYERKYGISPNLCFVNPAEAGSGERCGQVLVKPDKCILLNHLWIGSDDGQ